MTDLDYMYSQVPLLFGTPQQSIDVTINLSGDLLSAWSDDCIFCQGEESFDKTLSSTIKVGRMCFFFSVNALIRVFKVEWYSLALKSTGS